MFRALVLVFLLAILVTGLWLVYGLFTSVDVAGEKFVLLNPGSSGRQIAATLEREGIIRSAPAFLAWHALNGRPPLQAGEYRFSGSTRPVDVHERIRRGDVYYHQIIIPEGYNLFDIARTLEAAGLGAQQEFLSIARTEISLIQDLEPRATSLEGYLFPDTYRFTRTQSPRDMLATMVRRFRTTAQELGLSSNVGDIVTLASIVEKETSVPEERALIAGVFANRLRIGMPLQTDPSVIYAALVNNRWDGVIHRSDLDFESAYNTYRTRGLPPGPIANPGREALRAAMHPAQTDYLFFVSEGAARGRHRFSRTAAEHALNVQQYRRAINSR